MPTLFRFLMIVGVIAGVVTGSLYVLAEYFQPEPNSAAVSFRLDRAEASRVPQGLSLKPRQRVIARDGLL